VTLGEIEFWYRLNQIVSGPYPTLMDDAKDLKPFYDRVAGLQGGLKCLVKCLMKKMVCILSNPLLIKHTDLLT
jgi:hypothetical protein